MTVIATIISKHCCAHATDSLITLIENEKTIEYKKSKIVTVRPFFGIISYWGLAEYNNWKMYDWLNSKAGKAGEYSNPKDFAENICQELNLFISTKRFDKEEHKGFGIHFSAYETINGLKIPELFVIRNVDGTNYRQLYPGGAKVIRSTFDALPPNPTDCENEEDHGNARCRLKVREFLENDGIFIFNNGDPEMYNSTAYSIQRLFENGLAKRIVKKPKETRTYRQIITIPIKQISKLQTEFFVKGKQLVGGKTHNISVTPIGIYETDTKKPFLGFL